MNETNLDYLSSPASLFAVAARGDPSLCIWTQAQYYNSERAWDSSCGEEFEFFKGTPQENLFRFCPFCGRHLQEVVK